MRLPEEKLDQQPVSHPSLGLEPRDAHKRMNYQKHAAPRASTCAAQAEDAYGHADSVNAEQVPTKKCTPALCPRGYRLPTAHRRRSPADSSTAPASSPAGANARQTQTSHRQLSPLPVSNRATACHISASAPGVARPLAAATGDKNKTGIRSTTSDQGRCTHTSRSGEESLQQHLAYTPRAPAFWEAPALSAIDGRRCCKGPGKASAYFYK